MAWARLLVLYPTPESDDLVGWLSSDRRVVEVLPVRVGERQPDHVKPVSSERHRTRRMGHERNVREDSTTLCLSSRSRTRQHLDGLSRAPHNPKVACAFAVWPVGRDLHFGRALLGLVLVPHVFAVGSERLASAVTLGAFLVRLRQEEMARIRPPPRREPLGHPHLPKSSRGWGCDERVMRGSDGELSRSINPSKWRGATRGRSLARSRGRLPTSHAPMMRGHRGAVVPNCRSSPSCGVGGTTPLARRQPGGSRVTFT
jgi:hypothetical protein